MMDKIYNCPFCGGGVVTKSDFIEGLFLCENRGCGHIFKIKDASESDRKAFGGKKTDYKVYRKEEGN